MAAHDIETTSSLRFCRRGVELSETQVIAS